MLKKVGEMEDNASKQASDVEDLIQQNVDLILINPVDSAAVASAVESANAAGIPVITVDRSSEGGEVVSHIASDNVAGGVLAGEYLLELVGEGAKVAELEGVAGSSAARDRGEGLSNSIESVSEIDKLAVEETMPEISEDFSEENFTPAELESDSADLDIAENNADVDAVE